MKREFDRWPQYREMYIRAFDEMLEARRAAGKLNCNRLWTSGEGVFRWWIGENQGHDESQMTIFDGMED